MMRIAVVILNYNGRNLLEKFLPTVMQFSVQAKVVVADNASTDDSVLFTQNNFKNVEIIRLSTNTGFAGGYNAALKDIEAEYFVLLNSDLEVTEGWLQPVIDFMDANKNVAACQPKILSHSNKNLFEHAGAAGGYIDYLGYPFCRGRIFTQLEEDKGQYNQPAEIFWASGACMFIRSSVFKEMNGFDESFFAHMEEIDLCWRMKRKGYLLSVIPNSVVYHVGGGTLPKSNPRKTFLNFRNNLTMLFKNLPRHKILQVMFIRFFLDILAALKFLFEGDIADSAAVAKAYISFYKNRSEINRKRKSITDTKQITTAIYNGSIVFDYYLKGVKKFSELNKNLFS